MTYNRHFLLYWSTEKRYKLPTSTENNSIVLENDCVIVENYYVGERMITWNYNPSWYPRKR